MEIRMTSMMILMMIIQIKIYINVFDISLFDNQNFKLNDKLTPFK